MSIDGLCLQLLLCRTCCIKYGVVIGGLRLKLFLVRTYLTTASCPTLAK